MDVWPRPELAGWAGQGYGFMGHRLGTGSRGAANPDVLGRAPTSGLLLTGKGTPARARRSHPPLWARSRNPKDVMKLA